MSILRHAILKNVLDGPSHIVLEYDPDQYIHRLKTFFKQEMISLKKGKNKKVKQEEALSCLTKAYNSVNEEFKAETVKIA
ncbi:MAG: hypothetical protein DRP09_20830 [Candidatus Thorarchaeota archaeon]|nr:MAG: hypothetical protein DRP09_20830 [Candidatus Thorarchaeota archaeon]